MSELGSYRAKRDFRATSEPPPKRGPRRSRSAPRYVIQEHSARRLHWDLRLEHDGVLASWALPRGIPDDPKRNRKAVRTEDHPLEYLEFHGEIPAGSYGAGTMKIWDRGTFETEKWREDEVIVVLHGERCQGRYALFRAGEERDWMIHRMDPAADPAAEPMPRSLAPMLARPGQLPTDERNWAYEIKWDGVRAIAYVQPGEICIESRNLRDITRTYPELRPLARALGSRPAVLDGEIVAFDDDGRPSFSRLQERMHVESDSAARRRAERTPVTYMIFDLLYLDGRSLLAFPYQRRRERLQELDLAGAAWQTPQSHRGDGDGPALLAATAAQGLEGLVAKRVDSLYEPGRRSSAWVKVKNTRRQELVIGGWTPGEGRRTERLGALLVGHYDPEGRLVYAGKVGTGFSDKTLADLGRRLSSLRRDGSPFTGPGKPPRGARFVEPELVAEVEFTEWTPDGQLRHPSYQGLRNDRDPREVVREDPLALADESRDAPARANRSPRTAGARGDARSVKVGSDPEAIFDEVRATPTGYEVVLEGRTLRLSNYDKVLFPEAGFTKGQLIEYYARVAPAILPHLRDRALTLKRYPNGVEENFFYEKNCPAHRPDWVATTTVGGRRGGTTIDYCLIQDAPTLVWAANLASIELHTSLARAPRHSRPTMMVFDLDPGAPADLVQCCEVGLILRGLFDSLGLASLPKTSGGKGLQVYVPLNSDVSFAQTKGFSRQVAELLEGQAPELVVSRQTKALRAGRVLVDWSQNDQHKTTVNVYSVRAREWPTVSTPVSWEEVAAAHSAGDAGQLRFTTDEALDRLRAEGDLFAPVATVTQDLPAL
jgi:bifunctional non-homologous end joining protein LigD